MKPLPVCVVSYKLTYEFDAWGVVGVARSLDGAKALIEQYAAATFQGKQGIRWIWKTEEPVVDGGALSWVIGWMNDANKFIPACEYIIEVFEPVP